jgi:hypothetical protein
MGKTFPGKEGLLPVIHEGTPAGILFDFKYRYGWPASYLCRFFERQKIIDISFLSAKIELI